MLLQRNDKEGHNDAKSDAEANDDIKGFEDVFHLMNTHNIDLLI